jgi:type VI secretion system protein ImpK
MTTGLHQRHSQLYINWNKEITLTARYLICCLLDELVLSTPWGADSIWSHQTLLGKYHNETSGGEKFFLIVNKLLEQPQRNIDLIELCYVCLSAGFCGKYRVSKQGESELLQVSQKMYQHIEQHRPIDRDLSPSWQGAGKAESNLTKKVPSSLFFLLFGFILIATYIGFLSNLKAKVEPLYQKIESIGWDDFVLQINESQPESLDINTIAESLKGALTKYIDDKVIAIDVRNNMLIIRLVSTSLFKSGSSIVNEDALPDVNLLVNSIKDYADRVLVIGHTDSTGKADSNWVISRKRAEAIAMWLTKSNVQLMNTTTRGVADTQPLVKDTDNDYNQSINRRVELILVLKG